MDATSVQIESGEWIDKMLCNLVPGHNTIIGQCSLWTPIANRFW